MVGTEGGGDNLDKTGLAGGDDGDAELGGFEGGEAEGFGG